MTDPTRRSFLRFATAAAALSAAAPLLTACGSDGGDAPNTAGGKKVTKVGFDHPFNTVPLWSTIMKFAEQSAESSGAELLVAVDDAQLDKQLANLQGWIAQKVPAFTVLPMEVTSLEPVAKSALDAGLVWVTYAGEMTNQSGSVLLNNRESGLKLGQRAGRWISEEHGGRAKVVLLEYRESGTIGIERCDGMIEGLKQSAPDAEIVATQSASDPATGLQVMQSILSNRKDVNVVLCYNDDGATGAYRAFLNAGFDKNDPNVFIGGQDGAKEALELVQQRTMLRCSSALRISELARTCVEHPIALATGTASSPIVQMQVEALTADEPDKLSAYLADLA
ncbi:sugar ABC transporter substrate-binding protein [Pseudonocardia thermophila]|jgi:ABC-type sugar transport system, periplasmic component|uniref:sugar ABC transporter substrate-binding protein n=1 Tax=Pseudonocardia thermophila TaxID=1848 RepID=UPI00248E85CC|nr:sugar ABC transporter substrate-binding protein [Pseudonocardia thermophila]